ncbi:MAG: type I-C CRISPR-associated protein Cas5c [Permianibacter sp.]
MKRYCLEVTGDYACFSRPEMKVERVSYDLITPSAARAVFEAILWKPEIRWQVRQIELLKPIRWLNLRRNEVGSKVPVGSVKSVMNGNDSTLALYVDEDRQQRAGLFLRDVAYRLHADLNVLPTAAAANPAAKYQEMFERRARKGQCINQPYLGCREFACSFRLVESLETEPAPLPIDQDFGFMLHDLDFTDRTNPQPRFFRAQMRQGSVTVPAFEGEGLYA